MSNDNPVLTQAAGVTGFIVVVKALIVYSRVMGWINLDDSRYQATETLIDTVVPIAAIWVAALWARRRVTALTNPKDIDGTPLTRPDNAPAIPQLEKQQAEAIQLNKRIDERSLKR